MGRIKPNKPKRQRRAEGISTACIPEAAPLQILFDSSDPRIETFRKVQAQLRAGEEPDPADVQLLWDWHCEDNAPIR